MDDLLRLAMSQTPSLSTGSTAYHQFAFGGGDSASVSNAALQVELAGRIQYSCPGTWTHEEIVASFNQMLPVLARAKCHMILQSLPSAVLPEILPQLQEIAEHEVRMWQVRSELSGPDIHENRRRLPIAP